MAVTNIIKNICKKLGNAPKATYSMVAIATANGIFRPTFTMLKKGENPESKKYAALREGLTEAIAVPSYIICGEIGSKLGAYIGGKAKEKELNGLIQKGKTFTKETMDEMISVASKRGGSGLNLICICAAAGLIIPAVCSACVTPIMNKIGAKKPSAPMPKEAPIAPPTQLIQQPQRKITHPVFKNMTCSGMKVGGV